MYVVKWGIIATAIALLVSLLSGGRIIRKLIEASFGQEIREDGPSWHKKKSGTPTMGGFIFFAGLVLSVITVAALSGIFSFSEALVLISAILFGVVGFADDYIKVIKKRNLGLRAGQKFLAQALVSIAFSLCLYLEAGGEVLLFGAVDFSYFVIPFNVFVILATVNAVNLTDGIDGLAGTVSMISMLYLGYSAYVFGADMLFVIISAAIGGVIGFLAYNKHPAKVFMGDTGSLFLGGLIASSACYMGVQFTLVLVGLVFFTETLSVIIQVTYFKLTGGKRVFLMTPIHHHFEKKGWSEVKIVATASAITIVTGILSAIYVFYNL